MACPGGFNCHRTPVRCAPIGFETTGAPWSEVGGCHIHWTQLGKVERGQRSLRLENILRASLTASPPPARSWTGCRSQRERGVTDDSEARPREWPIGTLKAWSVVPAAGCHRVTKHQDKEGERMTTNFDGFFLEMSLIGAPWEAEAYVDYLAQLPSGQADLGDLVDDLEQIAHQEVDGQRVIHSFKSRISRGHTSWGSDASVLTLALDVAVSLGSMGMYDGLRLFFRKYATPQREPLHSYSDGELVEKAIGALVRRYGYTHDQLRATNIERVPSEPSLATIELVASGGAMIKLTVRLIEDIPVIEWIRRDLPA